MASVQMNVHRRKVNTIIINRHNQIFKILRMSVPYIATCELWTLSGWHCNGLRSGVGVSELYVSGPVIFIHWKRNLHNIKFPITVSVYVVSALAPIKKECNVIFRGRLWRINFYGHNGQDSFFEICFQLILHALYIIIILLYYTHVIKKLYSYTKMLIIIILTSLCQGDYFSIQNAK